jgi:hypothetical protein
MGELLPIFRYVFAMLVAKAHSKLVKIAVRNVGKLF